MALMIAGLAVVAGISLFHNLGGFRTLSSHEGYAMVPAREMLDSGNWIVPRFAGRPRLRKPPLAYWVIASSAQVFGGLNEWTARFPQALSAVMLSILIGVWAARWYGRRAGFAAALVQLTSVYVLNYGRKAEVDMLLCLLTTGCLFLVANQPSDESRAKGFVRWAAVYCLIAISWLAKFHYGPAMVLAVCGAYFVVQRQFRRLWNLANPAGLTILAAAMLIWPWLVLKQLPEAWNVWETETLGRAVGDLGTRPFWFYVPQFVVVTLPWTPLVLAAMPRSWSDAWKGNDSRERFLWVWLITQLLIVHASADKHPHYLFAALPMCSLLAGRQLAVFAERITREGWTLPTWKAATFSIISLAVGAGVTLLAGQKWPHLAVPATAVAIVAAIGACACLWLCTWSQPQIAGVVAVCTFLACLAGVYDWIIPGRDHRQPAAQFALETRETIPSGESVYAYGMGEGNPVVYYLGSPTSRFESLDEVSAELDRSGRSLVLAYQTDAMTLAETVQSRVLREMQVEPTDALKPKHPPLVLLELRGAESRTASKPQQRR